MYLFDMDGTLIDSNSVWKDVDREFLARRGLPYTKAYYEGVARTIFPLAAKFTKEFCHLPESEEAIMAEWMDLAKDAYAHVTVKPGVRAFLKQCRSENRRMALVTSSVPVHCRTAMEKLDLMKYFESVTFAQELGSRRQNGAFCDILRSVIQSSAELTDSMKKTLQPLTEALGRTPMQTEEQVLHSVLAAVRQEEKYWAERETRQGTLSRRLGILGGIVLVVLLI